MFFGGNLHFAQPEFGYLGPTFTPNDWRAAYDGLSQGYS
jgi:hypothetical protein